MSVQKLFDLAVLQDTPYRPVPYFFFYDLMPISRGVPPMFWKFTFVLWCDVTRPTKVGEKKYIYELKCAKSMRKWGELHGINKAAAMDFTLAYRYSGMFEVAYGFKHIEMFSGQPTIYEYDQEATVDDWKAFIKGLSESYQTAKKWGMSRRGKVTAESMREQNAFKRKRNLFREADKQLEIDENESAIDSSLTFQLLMAVNIDDARRQLGLPAKNQAAIKELLEQGAGSMDKDGVISYRFKAAPKNFR
jgi:hypothetical protein